MDSTAINKTAPNSAWLDQRAAAIHDRVELHRRKEAQDVQKAKDTYGPVAEAMNQAKSSSSSSDSPVVAVSSDASVPDSASSKAAHSYSAAPQATSTQSWVA